MLQIVCFCCFCNTVYNSTGHRPCDRTDHDPVLLTEQVHPFVIGRNNWLFVGSPKGAVASAGIYALVETVKANGLVPMEYLKYILSDMPGSTFLENLEYLDDYLSWDPMVQKRCR